MKVKVFAKLNLALNVYPKQGEFHPIDSVCVSVDVFDVVQVKPRRDKKVTLKGFLPTAENIAYKTAVAFAEKFDTNGVDMVIQKSIPVGAGMGGSSADCAAVIFCMCKLFGVDIQDQRVNQLCSLLGSDVTFMLTGGLGRMQGKGDCVTFGSCPTQYFVLTVFSTMMSAGQVYNAFDSLPSQAFVDCQQMFQMLTSGQDAQKIQNNHLQLACQSLSSYAQSYLYFAKDNGFVTNMTGSGSAYYVWCQSEQQATEIYQKLRSCGFSSKVCQSVPFGIQVIQ